MSEPAPLSDDWFDNAERDVFSDSPEVAIDVVNALREVAATALEWAADKGSLWVGRMGADTPEPVVHRDWLRAKAREIRGDDA
jgi:hypothetical protein